MTIYIQIQEDPRFSGERDFYWRSGEIIIIFSFILKISFYSLIILYKHLISNLWLFYIIRIIFDLDVSLFHKKFGSKRKITNPNLTLKRSSRRKVSMRWFFEVYKLKESSFFQSDLTDPLRFFMRIFWKIPI